MNGVLIIDKGAGLTSHDVVNRVRRILGQHSVGHLGTLDPMATGVLPLVTGNFTRLAQFYLSSEKTYEGTVRFGFCTDTYDAEGEPTTDPTKVTLQLDDIESAAGRFRGVIEQTPPPFSAKKIKGIPAYKLARKQKEVKLQPVQVEIKEFEVLGVDVDRMRFRARVSSGTYLRSIAHDLGKNLGCGAHLEALRRTSVAEFTIGEAHTLEELAASAGKPALFGDSSAPSPAREHIPGKSVNDLEAARWDHATSVGTMEAQMDLQPLHELFIHPRKLLPLMPCVTADELSVARIRSGRTVNLPDLSRARLVKVFVGQRDLLAIATRIAGTLFHPKIVFSGASQ